MVVPKVNPEAALVQSAEHRPASAAAPLAAPFAARHLVLDVSRLLERAGQPVPTGIDRVELAWAESLLDQAPERLDFAAFDGLGRIGLLPRLAARRLIRRLALFWQGGDGGSGEAAALRRASLGLRAGLFWSGRRRLDSGGRPVTYLLLSHHHLDRPAAIRRLCQDLPARFACLVHDLIPLEFPEYVRPGHDQRHRQRMLTVASQADLILFTSEATQRAFAPLLAASGRQPRQQVSHLGSPMPARPGPVAAAARPYFLMVSTIEPRKNHLLLLQLWRRLAETEGAACPRLILVGQRGWENENILDLLERCPSLQGVVEEHNRLSDAAMAALLAGARAVLMPSFAEGYGLPLAEALEQGVPVLCSDLPVFHEIAGPVPDYLDPLDGLGWLQAIRDYSAPDSARRAAQCRRLGSWQPRRWQSHVNEVMAAL